ncbi:MAG: AI-2E family transporter, partial [Chloroflexi bacterium]|nr:AI-2E family transporter [Chloroflexota bacterium]
MSQVTSIVGQALVVVQYAVGFLSGALNGVFVLILALYFTSDAHRIIGFAMSFLAPARRPRTQRILGHIGERLGGWLRGQVLLSLIIGGICLVGLLALGVPYAVLLAL